LSSLKSLLLDRYRCPASEMPDFEVPGILTNQKGFFRFGQAAVCYGRATGEVRSDVTEPLQDVLHAVSCGDRRVSVPFNPGEVVDDLRYERYFNTGTRLLEKPGTRNLYYRVRPLLPDFFRRHLQKFYLKEWERLTFPAWPVDCTVDVILEQLLAFALKATGQSRIPFIWFWPRHHKACAIMTHDIETLAGRNFTPRLLDIDAQFGVRSSVQVVPEERYEVPAEFLDEIRRRDCEINIHGLNHDGNLFQNRATFLERATKINRYAEAFGAKGFRSPVMYRNPDWLRELNFSYDMSFPNSARHEPQPGGCCTLLPYSLPGGMTELPLTTIQDYALFHLLNDYSTSLWKQQIKAITERNGLISFIVHPDYVQTGRAQSVYKALLGELERAQCESNVWLTIAGEVDQWWRQRDQMSIVGAGQDLRIEGAGSERASIAYACLDGDKLAFEFPSEAQHTENAESLVKEGAC
jgi:hypothetical protein